MLTGRASEAEGEEGKECSPDPFRTPDAFAGVDPACGRDSWTLTGVEVGVRPLLLMLLALLLSVLVLVSSRALASLGLAAVAPAPALPCTVLGRDLLSRLVAELAMPVEAGEAGDGVSTASQCALTNVSEPVWCSQVPMCEEGTGTRGTSPKYAELHSPSNRMQAN